MSSPNRTRALEYLALARVLTLALARGLILLVVHKLEHVEHLWRLRTRARARTRTSVRAKVKVRVTTRGRGRTRLGSVVRVRVRLVGLHEYIPAVLLLKHLG